MTDPNWQRDDAAAVAPQLQRLQDFFDGTDAVRAAKAKYLPQLEKEPDRNYKLRSTGSAVPGSLTRTVEASVGRIFAVSPTIDVMGYPGIEDEWDDVDGLGTHGDVWLARTSIYAILDGYALALIDAAPTEAAVVPMHTRQQHAPRWISYRRSQLLNWRTAVMDGRTVLTLAVLSEVADVPDGEWGLTQEQRVRVLRNTMGLITVELWALRESADGKEAWIVIEAPRTYRGPSEIPLAVFAGGKMHALFCARPPLLALCDKVIEFYQVASDMRHYERMSCFPQPVVSGTLTTIGGDGKLVLGPTSAIQVDSGGDFKWAELAGTSMDQLRQNQQGRLQEIGALGLSFLVTETRQAETARAKALDAAAENATLSDAARGIEDGANQALAFHVAYWGVSEEQAPELSINKNLSGDVIDAPTMTALLAMRAAGELTRSEFREILARGKVIPVEMATADAVIDANMEEALLASLRVLDEPTPAVDGVVKAAA